MDEFSALLAAGLAPYLAAGRRLCVGLSGGCDSVALLHALRRLCESGALPGGLSAVHVNHGLSPNAGDWARFCERLCDEMGVRLTIVEVKVPRESGEGLEAAARRRRFAAFASLDVDAVVLAHHRDDQAETVLMNLLRGAGVAGAAGMRPSRPMHAPRRGPALLRPALDAPRSMLHAYARANGLRWIEDESNEDTYFRRNFLRREILPALDGRFPGASDALARAARHFAEASVLLDDLAGLDRAAVAKPSGRLGLSAFNRLPPARARNLLRFAWRAAGFHSPETRWIEEAREQLASAQMSGSLCVQTAEGALRVYRGEIYLSPLMPEAPCEAAAWRGEDSLPWAGGRVRFTPTLGEGIACAALKQQSLWLRPRQGGERLRPDPRRPRRSVSALCQQAGVPPWERPLMPFLWIGERLAWVASLGVEAEFACPPGEAGVLPMWSRDHPEAVKGEK